jgi:hypothetical protein
MCAFFFRTEKGKEFPINWKFAIVCPVNKGTGGRGSGGVLGNQRKIFLLPCQRRHFPECWLVD